MTQAFLLKGLAKKRELSLQLHDAALREFWVDYGGCALAMFTDHTLFQLLTKAQDIGKGGAAKAFKEGVNPVQF